jgi:hypothetical protein
VLRLIQSRSKVRAEVMVGCSIKSDFKLLSGFPCPINGNADNILESICMFLEI